MSATRYERLKSGLIVPKGKARRVTPPSGPTIITRRNLLASGAAALLCPTPAQAVTFNPVAHVTIPASGSSGGTSAGINPSGSTGTFIAWAANRFTGPSLSDSLGNGYGSNIGGNANSNWQLSMGYNTNPPTAAAGQTFSLSGPGTNAQGIAFGFNLVTGLVQANNGTAFDTAGGTTISTPSISPTTANNLAISICALANNTMTATVDSGFTIIDTLLSNQPNCYGLVVAYKAQNTAAAVAPTWTFSFALTGGAVARTCVFGLTADPFASPKGTLFHSFPP